MLLFPFLVVTAYAEEYPASMVDELDVSAVRESLPEELRKIGGELRFSGDYDGAGALERLWNRFLAQIAEALRKSAREVFSVLALAILCALGTSLAPGQKQSEYIQIAGCAAASCLQIGRAHV